MITPLDNDSVSRFVVPKRVETPPVVYLYNSTSTATSLFESISKCVTQAQLPAGMLVRLGTPESVAKVAINVLVFTATFVTTVCSAPTTAVGDHCLYVGLPKAVFVFKD